jgi:TatD DNase family protein
MKSIDAHIHLDQYSPQVCRRMMSELAGFGVQCLIAVAMNLPSCKKLLRLQRLYPKQVKPAFGFHPEQKLPSKTEMDELFSWIVKHRQDMTAIGEVGLPYYNQKEALERGENFEEKPYIDLLERFIMLAAELNKPIVLHAVYEDADIACDLLQKHGVKEAHFHWFKGSDATISRMIQAGYWVSFTPDILYEVEIQQLAAIYPLQQIMVETDGPWPFEGPFAGQTTHPRMLTNIIQQIAAIKGIDRGTAAETILQNTQRFYNLSKDSC